MSSQKTSHKNGFGTFRGSDSAGGTTGGIGIARLNRATVALAAALTAAWASPVHAFTHVVTQVGLTFSPANIVINVGDTIEWRWTSGNHTVTEGPGPGPCVGCAFDSPLTSGTPVFSVTFDAAFLAANPRAGDVYDYYCEPHHSAGMIGSVTVASLLPTCQTLVADLSGQQTTPPISTAARGCGMFFIDTVADEVSYYIVHSGLVSEIAAHIHGPADPGGVSGIKHTLPLGSPKVGVWAYAAADEQDILAGRMYVNIHTSAFPNGELRGQIGTHAATINGFQEEPSTGSAGSGWGTFVINRAANTLSYYIAIDAGTAAAETAAHIHGLALHTTNAGVLHTLPLGTPKTGVWNYAEAQEQAILNGQTYVNVHTGAFPGGEIRGQIVSHVAPMDGSQEVPAVTTAAAGCAFFAHDPVGGVLSYYIETFNLSSGETGAHIHGYAPRGVNAGVVHALPAGNPKKGSWNYPAADKGSVLQGLTYVNVHTSMHLTGEIRGQIEGLRGVWGDLDRDGDVDLDDFGLLAACYNGANNPPAPTCPACVDADCDGDGDVDLDDFSLLAANYTGSL